eukprot:tig00020904_g15259.t1
MGSSASTAAARSRPSSAGSVGSAPRVPVELLQDLGPGSAPPRPASARSVLSAAGELAGEAVGRTARVFDDLAGIFRSSEQPSSKRQCRATVVLPALVELASLVGGQLIERLLSGVCPGLDAGMIIRWAASVIRLSQQLSPVDSPDLEPAFKATAESLHGSVRPGFLLLASQLLGKAFSRAELDGYEAAAAEYRRMAAGHRAADFLRVENALDGASEALDRADADMAAFLSQFSGSGGYEERIPAFAASTRLLLARARDQLDAARAMLEKLAESIRGERARARALVAGTSVAAVATAAAGVASVVAAPVGAKVALGAAAVIGTTASIREAVALGSVLSACEGALLRCGLLGAYGAALEKRYERADAGLGRLEAAVAGAGAGAGAGRPAPASEGAEWAGPGAPP